MLPMSRLWPYTIEMSDQSPCKDQKSLMPVGQSNQTKTHAMVARSHEDGEEVFMCENMERPRSSGNSKKRNLNRLTSDDDDVIYSAACHAQSIDSQIYIEIGKLNGRPVKVLRDTGCTGMIVNKALIPDLMVIPGSSASLQMVDHTLINVPLVNVYLDSPYYKGHCKVMYVSSPIYPLIIVNVRGARQILPDPDWKAEEKLKLGPVGETTMMMPTKVVICLVGCSKRCPIEEKQRRETQRRSQP